ncbi:hypothetical protein [Moorena producens]|uniref:hypothetical protein n=1 Tax=Moorena producens TaxID=1155739 RepID=UPI003C77CBB9
MAAIDDIKQIITSLKDTQSYDSKGKLLENEKNNHKNKINELMKNPALTAPEKAALRYLYRGVKIAPTKDNDKEALRNQYIEVANEIADPLKNRQGLTDLDKGLMLIKVWQYSLQVAEKFKKDPKITDKNEAQVVHNIARKKIKEDLTEIIKKNQGNQTALELYKKWSQTTRDQDISIEIYKEAMTEVINNLQLQTAHLRDQSLEVFSNLKPEQDGVEEYTNLERQLNYVEAEMEKIEKNLITALSKQEVDIAEIDQWINTLKPFTNTRPDTTSAIGNTFNGVSDAILGILRTVSMFATSGLNYKKGGQEVIKQQFRALKVLFDAEKKFIKKMATDAKISAEDIMNRKVRALQQQLAINAEKRADLEHQLKLEEAKRQRAEHQKQERREVLEAATEAFESLTKSEQDARSNLKEEDERLNVNVKEQLTRNEIKREEEKNSKMIEKTIKREQRKLLKPVPVIKSKRLPNSR